MLMIFRVLLRLLAIGLLISVTVYAQRQWVEYFWLKTSATFALAVLAYSALYHGYLKNFYRKRPRFVDFVITDDEAEDELQYPGRRMKRRTASLGSDASLMDGESQPTTPSPQAPLLTTFLASNIKVFSFLDPHISRKVAATCTQIMLEPSQELAMHEECYYLLVSGSMEMRRGELTCSLVGPSAISMLMLFVADLLELPKSQFESSGIRFKAISTCNVINIGPDGKRHLAEQTSHLVRVFLSRFRRVTSRLCIDYLPHLAVDLVQIYRGAGRVIDTLDERLIAERIWHMLKMPSVPPLHFVNFTNHPSNSIINNDETFCVVHGEVQIDYVDKSSMCVTSGYCNVEGSIIFASTMIRSIRAKSDCRLAIIKDASPLRNNLDTLRLCCKMLFDRLTPDLLLIDSFSKWQRLLPGETVCTRDAKVVLHGRIKCREQALGPGECFQHDLILSGGEPTVCIALRESELAGMPAAMLDHFAKQEPKAALNLAQLQVTPPRPIDQFSTVAIVPMTHRFRPMALEFAAKLEGVLTATTSCCLLDSALILDILGRDAFQAIGKLKLQEFLTEKEEHSRCTLLLSLDGPRSAWTKRCLRNADLVLVVADGTLPASEATSIGEYEEILRESISHCRVQLVLLHDQWKRRVTGVSQWLAPRPWVHGHSHVYMGSTSGSSLRAARRTFDLLKRWQPRMMYERDELKPRLSERQQDDTDIDLRRLARQILGKRLALVLSGGGARGCAHVGVIRALREAGIQVDIVGGASMGSLVGALYADQAYSWYALPTLVRFFSERMGSWWRQSLDLTLPIIAWFTGHHLNRTLWKLFGETGIDDLWIEYFCVTTDLTNNCLRVHRRGSDSQDFLWRYIRASMSLGGVIPPICDRQGNILVDGGYANNIPTDIALGEPFHADMAIVVDISNETRFRPHSFGDTVSGWALLARKLLGLPLPTPDFTDLQMKLIYLATNQQQERIMQTVSQERILMLRPPVNMYDTLEFQHCREITQIGYEYTQAMIRRWREDGTLDRLLFLQSPVSAVAPKDPRRNRRRSI